MIHDDVIELSMEAGEQGRVWGTAHAQSQTLPGQIQWTENSLAFRQEVKAVDIIHSFIHSTLLSVNCASDNKIVMMLGKGIQGWKDMGDLSKECPVHYMTDM